jgi:hypothetical protein
VPPRWNMETPGIQWLVESQPSCTATTTPVFPPQPGHSWLPLAVVTCPLAGLLYLVVMKLAPQLWHLSVTV